MRRVVHSGVAPLQEIQDTVTITVMAMLGWLRGTEYYFQAMGMLPLGERIPESFCIEYGEGKFACIRYAPSPRSEHVLYAVSSSTYLGKKRQGGRIMGLGRVMVMVKVGRCGPGGQLPFLA